MKEDFYLKLKTLKYLLFNKNKVFKNYFLNHFFSLSIKYLKSFFQKPFKKDGITFFSLNSKDPIDEFKKALKNRENPLLIGLSYCQKNKKCPSEFFSSSCSFSCLDCSIKEIVSDKNIKLRKNTHFKIITTIFSLGEKIIELKKLYPSSQILFIISACPLAIKMFENFAYSLDLKGVAFELTDKVCNSFECFKLAEEGKKPFSTKMSFYHQKVIKELLNLY